MEFARGCGAATRPVPFEEKRFLGLGRDAARGGHEQGESGSKNKKKEKRLNSEKTARLREVSRDT